MHGIIVSVTRRVLLLVGLFAFVALAVMARSSSPAVTAPSDASSHGLAGIRLQNVARQVGLDFRQGAFRFGMSRDLTAMTGGGLCTLDYNGDGWLDLCTS